MCGVICPQQQYGASPSAAKFSPHTLLEADFRAEGTTFARGGQKFCPIGFNAYYLSYCSDVTQIAVLRQARQQGANTIRAWAFSDCLRADESNCTFQLFDDDEVLLGSGLSRLDALIAHAEEAGIGLILPLVNGWSDFGGMPLYAKAFGCGSTAEDFFGCERARQQYDIWVERVLTRRNSITGRFYLEEPAIFAWELANEPRHSGVGGRNELLEWAAQSSENIQRVDKSHLVAVGDEGFFARPGRQRYRFTRSAHLYDARYGVDAEALIRLPSIDFGTYHFYPETWGVSAGFGVRWIDEHARIGTAAGKPVLLEEFGLGSSNPERFRHYAEWLHMACKKGAGALLWMLGSREPDASGFRDRYALFSNATQNGEQSTNLLNELSA